MTKKIVALLLALVMVLAMTACAKTEAPKADAPAADAPAADAPAADEPAADAPAADDGEIYTLTYYEIANSDTAVREEVQNAINAHIEPLIGANIEFALFGWGDWDSKALTALQAGEKIDIFFTADWKSYVRSVNMNLFTPLNDDNGEYGNLLETYGQEMLATHNPFFITGTQYNGVNYAVPTNKEVCVPMGYIYNVVTAEEVGLDPTAIKDVEDFEPYFAKFKELHPDWYPYLSDGSWGSEPWVPGFVSIGGNVLTMKQELQADGNFDLKVYNVWETEENKKHVETMYKFFQAGYVHPDSPLSTFDVATSPEWAAGQWLVQSAPLKGNNIKGNELVIASGNLDMKVDEIYGQGKYIVTTHAGGSMLAIPVSSEDPVKAMKYICLLHTDKELLDMQLFGVPEVHWTLAEDGRVQQIDTQWYSSHGGAWTMGNTALQNVTTNEDPTKNQALQDYGKDAVPHASLGFRYSVPAELEAQWAAVANVADAMNRSLLTGAVDPATTLEQYKADLKAAGIDEIQADVQAKFDEWYAAVNG